MTPKRKHGGKMSENVTPKSTSALIAPNMYAEVEKTMTEHPEIDRMNEETRGEIIDITDWRVNGGLDRPWGRKARNNDPNNPNLNSDGMTYLRPDGLFEIYDCISGVNGAATWDGYGPFAQGENGYWWPPMPVDDQPPVTGGGGGSTDTSALEARIAELEKQVIDLQNNSLQYSSRIVLQSNNSMLLCAENGGPSKLNTKYDLTSRDSAGPWETWTLVKP